MNQLARAFLVAVLALAGATQVSCNINDYCLNCAKGDAHGSGSDDGGDGDGNLGSDGGNGDGGPCVPTGPEICDGKDNDCNGLTDDGVLPNVGDLCANQMGECAGGIQQCVNGALTCTKKPSPEVCDNKDNDCNGLTDEGDPGGGAKCGTDMGECTAGHMHCVAGGTIQCTGAIGGTMSPFGTPETCNAKDDDCDGNFDEGLTNMGQCGVSNVGICTLGVLTCIGGAPACDTDPNTPGIQPPIQPGFEICNYADDDCDGTVDNGFNLQADPQNCGGCTLPMMNHVCGANLPNGGNANWGCAPNGTYPAAKCVITSCKAGYHDNNNDPIDGCEFGVCFSSGPEVCDGVDNDCNGMTDEGLTTPVGLCNQVGECAGSTASCGGLSGWKCNYGMNVSQTAPGSGIIAPETLCDQKDNDCNGIIDDHQPQVAHADGTTLTPVDCHDSLVGECQSRGKYACDTTSLVTQNGPAKCDFTAPGSHLGAASTAEVCDNLDNDCDGVVDNGANTGNLVGQNWINIGSGHCSVTITTACTANANCPAGETCSGIPQMMQYEASKPDASATDSGNVTTATCSRATVLPWTNLKYPQALAACQAVGATLCTDQQWHRACGVVAPATYPIAVSGAGTRIEAEDYYAIASATATTTHSWVEDYTLGYSGISAMSANPNDGTSVALGNALSQAPRLDYLINFTAMSNNYHVFVRMYSTSGNDHAVHVGISANTTPAAPTASVNTNNTNNSWRWRDAGAFNIAATGQRMLSVFMSEDGVKIDQIFIEIGNTAPNPTNNGAGNTWAYAMNATTYQPTTCNGHDNPQAAISAIARATNVVSVTTSSAHQLAVGDLVQISGVTDTSFNGVFTVVTVGSTTTFTVAQTAADATSMNGVAIPPVDNLLATGSQTSCYAAVTASDHAFDMSGNAKEWTLAHQAGYNPIRGGSFNDTALGTSCALNFSLGDDKFFFPNVGFRCCRTLP